jgi:hypothetical protein
VCHGHTSEKSGMGGENGVFDVVGLKLHCMCIAILCRMFRIYCLAF